MCFFIIWWKISNLSYLCMLNVFRSWQSPMIQMVVVDPTKVNPEWFTNIENVHWAFVCPWPIGSCQLAPCSWKWKPLSALLITSLYQSYKSPLLMLCIVSQNPDICPLQLGLTHWGEKQLRVVFFLAVKLLAFSPLCLFWVFLLWTSDFKISLAFFFYSQLYKTHTHTHTRAHTLAHTHTYTHTPLIRFLKTMTGKSPSIILIPLACNQEVVTCRNN